MKIFFILLLSALLLVVHGRPMDEKNRIKTIYSFGDSLTDTGNLMHLSTKGAIHKSMTLNIGYPYGLKTFNTSTGRCSDGLLIIDYLANELGLPFLNPYLDEEANFAHGVNFAVAGATAQDVNFFANLGLTLANSSLSVQFSWFKYYLNSKCSSSQECAKMLKESLIVLGEIGGNDYNYQFILRRNIQDIYANIPKVVNNITSVAQELIDMGAINIMIPGNFPIGCLPSYLTIFNATEEKCLEPFNDFAKAHNQYLMQAITNLRIANPFVNIVYANFYEAFMHMLDNVDELGFEKTFKTCCGVGGVFNFDLTKRCGLKGTSLCEDTTKYINWDGIHLTQQAYLTLAKILIEDGYTFPNFNLLYKWRV